MKKSTVFIFFVGILFGIVGYFSMQYYKEKQENLRLKSLNLITSVEEFVSRIKFHDGKGITMAEADMFYYNLVKSKEDKVIMFSAREFYAQNEKDQNSLIKMINFFKGAKLLKGINYSKKIDKPKMKIHESLHKWDADHENTFNKIKNSLEEKLKKSRISEKEMETLRYIYTLNGQYLDAERLNKSICKKSKNKCKNFEKVLVTGIVTNSKGEPIKDTTIMVLNYPLQEKAITGDDGKFKLKLKTNSLDKIRLRAVKRGFSDGYRDFFIYHPEDVTLAEKTIKREVNFVLNRSHAVVLLDLDNHSIELKKKGIIKSTNFKDGQFHLKTNSNVYHIPINCFIDVKENSQNKGKVELHLYEFDRQSVYDVGDLVLLDISSDKGNRVFLGGFLQTFGMPYMQFFTEKGKELFVKKSNPIELTYQIVEMDILKNREQNPVTDEELEKLVQYSKKLGGYPLTREFLIEKNLFSMPPWWMLNRKKGMWENVPFRLINKEGRIESIFYSYGS